MTRSPWRWLPVPDAALTAAIPIGLAWLVDHAIQVSSSTSIVNGAIVAATPLAARVPIWVLGWALGVASALVAAAGARRGVPVGPLRAIAAVFRRGHRVAAWFLPYAVFAAGCSWAALRWMALDGLLGLVVPVVAVLTAAVFAIRRWSKMMVLPTAILSDERPYTTARALASDRLSLGLLGLLVAPALLPLAIDPVRDAVAGASSSDAAPFAVATISGVSLLSLVVLVAGQATVLARWYLASRPSQQPGRVADVAAADAALARFAAPSPRRVRGAWLASLVVPAVLLAWVVVANPAGDPALRVTAVAAPRAVGLDGAGRAVLVSEGTMTRCLDLSCDAVSTTPLPGPFVAASVAPDGRVVTVGLPGFTSANRAAELTECDSGGRCTRQALDLVDDGGAPVSAAVAGLPDGGALVVIFHKHSDAADGQAKPLISAWACVPGCRAVPVDIPAGVRLRSPSGLTVGHDRSGAPVLGWFDGGWYAGDTIRAACPSPDCGRLLVQALPAAWHLVPRGYNVAGLGIDGRGDIMLAGGRSLRAGRPTADYCPIGCWEFPNVEPPTLAIVTCVDLYCSGAGPERPLLPVSRSRIDRVLVTASIDGRPVVVVADASRDAGSLVTCVDRCDSPPVR